MSNTKDKKISYFSALTPVVLSLLAIAVSAGYANAKIEEAFTRIDKQEQSLYPALGKLSSDVNEIKIKVAETARDVHWLKEQQINHDE
jgi:outer membrane murein-binding lipoprotein Lpp